MAEEGWGMEFVADSGGVKPTNQQSGVKPTHGFTHLQSPILGGRPLCLEEKAMRDNSILVGLPDGRHPQPTQPTYLGVKYKTMGARGVGRTQGVAIPTHTGLAGEGAKKHGVWKERGGDIRC